MLVQTMRNLADLSPTQDKQQIDITFRNILYEVPVKSAQSTTQLKTILHGVTGIFKAAEVSVIMGASGAGKTTLLNILAGRIDNFKGDLSANDTPYSFQNFGDFANYVMQQDILIQTLTVRQTLEFAAYLKLDQNKVDIKARISELVAKFKLQKCLDVLVGGQLLKGVSGGEKKRTSIAFQLMGNPQVILLDQPTSGIDSLTSFIIINQLKQLAKEGRTIILTIHQPNSEIFYLFDNLVLMVEGQIIFQGPAANAVPYFGTNFGLHCGQFQNPADYLMSIIHQESQENTQRYPKYFKLYNEANSLQIATLLQNRSHHQIIARKIQNSTAKNLKLLLKRDYINIVRNPIVMKSRIVQIIFMSVYTGGLYFSDGRVDYTNIINWFAIIGYMFFISMDLFMQSLMPIALTFPMQRMVFLKQQNAKMYGLGSYFLSRNIIEIPYLIIIPMIYQLINYWMIGLGNTAQQFFTMYFTILILSFTGTSLGFLVGSSTTDPALVANLPVLFMFPFLVFSGFFKNIANLSSWISWIRYISPFNYSYTAFVRNQTAYKPSLVNELNFDTSVWASIGILFLLGLFFRFLSFLILWLKKGKLE